jgi:3',5'-cyclic AMP phosphodiesterase CpdA
MLTLLHISDLHFGPPFLPAVGAALQRIAPTLNPHVLVVSGDLTQRAKREQFAAAREFLGSLLPQMPRLVVPGNHDVPLYRFYERMRSPHGLFREFITDRLDQVLRVDGAVLVGLDSTAPHTAITNGRISAEQLRFVEDALRDANHGDARIVVAHHHFAPAPDYERDQTLPNARQVLRHFNELKVDLILGGHLHRAYIGNSLDLFPDRASGHQGIIIVQCGTSTSRRGRARERQRNSFNVVMLTPSLVHITHYMYFEDSDAFEPISRHMFPRRGMRMGEG